jgi:predicted homoserine dehydrogenase-like protein
MIIVDTALKKRAAENKPVKVAMIGAGFMARGTANQIINSVPGMRLVAIANRTLDRARRAYVEAGVDASEIVEVESAKGVEGGQKYFAQHEAENARAQSPKRRGVGRDESF